MHTQSAPRDLINLVDAGILEFHCFSLQEMESGPIFILGFSETTVFSGTEIVQGLESVLGSRRRRGSRECPQQKEPRALRENRFSNGCIHK